MAVAMHLSWLLCLVAGVLLSPGVSADCELETVKALHNASPEWQPNAIIDVGANVGCWTRRGRQVFPNTKFMMYEAFENFADPLKKAKAESPDGTVDFAIEVLSGEAEDVQFWAEGATGNSMFPQLLGRGGRGHGDIKPVTRTTKTLDSARKLSFLANERVDILKLDVQGAELEVLKGATEMLKEASFVQFESSVIEYNKGGSCQYEVDELLRHHGFYLYDLGDLQRNNGLFRTTGVGQYDALYMRPSSEHLPESIRSLGPNLCGSNNRDNSKLPIPFVSIEVLSSPAHATASMKNISITSLDEAPAIESGEPCSFMHQSLWAGRVGTLAAGIIIGRYLLPRGRARKEQ